MSNRPVGSALRAAAEDFYSSNIEYVKDELLLLDMRISGLVSAADESGKGFSLDSLKGLVISDSEVRRLLHGKGSRAQENHEAGAKKSKVLKLQESIERKVETSMMGGAALNLPKLCAMMNLTEFEKLCIIAALAVEIDRRYETLFAYINDDVTQKAPTVYLVAKLLDIPREDSLILRGYFKAGSALRKFIFAGDMNTASENTPLLSTRLKLDERIVDYILGSDEFDKRLEAHASLIAAEQDTGALLTGHATQDAMRKFAGRHLSGEEQDLGNIVFYLFGPSGSGRKTHAIHLGKCFGQKLIIADTKRLLNSEKGFGENLCRIGREILLQQAMVCFDGIDSLIEEEGKRQSELNRLLELINSFTTVFFLTSERQWKPGNLLEGHRFISIEFSVPGDSERRVLWEKLSGYYNMDPDVDLDALAGKFRFTPGQISNALKDANNLGDFKSTGTYGISSLDIYSACYSQASHHLDEKSTKISPRYTLEDIVLPGEPKSLLVDICSRVKYHCIVYGEWGFDKKLAYGKGLSTIFYGPPGTGKTMAVQAIANELKLELYKIDLSQTVSKYIGETEKNLHHVFTEAQSSNAILFFDEADALFGKRSEVKDSKDRYANIETAYLLQKIEEYEGLTILATNFNGNIDDAFIRRMQFIVEFPFPNAEYRELIWRSAFPKEAPLSGNIDYGFLADKFEISGGNIKNIVVSAAFLAAAQSREISMEHIIKAAKYELKKIGKILLKEDLGEYF